MAATKNFRVDSFVVGLAIKAPCIVVSAVNLTLSGEQTVNGVAVVAGDRVLVKDQTDGIENGIYNVETSAWQRAGDFDGNRDIVKGTLVTVNVTNGRDFFYQVTTANPITIGTTAITFILVNDPNDRILAKTANYNIEAADHGQTFTSTGATGIITGILPASALGLQFTFVRTVAFAHRIDPDGTEVIRNAGSAGAAGKYLSLDTIGGSVTLKCAVAGTWEVIAINGGTITFEA